MTPSSTVESFTSIQAQLRVWYLLRPTALFTKASLHSKPVLRVLTVRDARGVVSAHPAVLDGHTLETVTQAYSDENSVVVAVAEEAGPPSDALVQRVAKNNGFEWIPHERSL